MTYLMDPTPRPGRRVLEDALRDANRAYADRLWMERKAEDDEERWGDQSIALLRLALWLCSALFMIAVLRWVGVL